MWCGCELDSSSPSEIILESIYQLLIDLQSFLFIFDLLVDICQSECPIIGSIDSQAKHLETFLKLWNQFRKIERLAL
jgi:hypothetical protein